MTVMCVALSSAAAGSTKVLHVLNGREPTSKELKPMEGGFQLVTRQSTLVTPGGAVECSDDESGPNEFLVEEEMARKVFILAAETSVGGFPCHSSMDLGEGNLVIAPVELALNVSGKVEAPGLQVTARFSAGADCSYVGAHARGTMPIGPTPVALAVDFVDTRLKLGGGSSPICPRTAKLFTTFAQPGPQTVYVEN